MLDPFDWTEIEVVEIDYTAIEQVVQKTFDLSDMQQLADFCEHYHFGSISLFDIDVRNGVRKFWHKDKATVFCSNDPIALSTEVEAFLNINAPAKFKI